MVLFQGPYFYYFSSGFVKLVFLLPFAVTGLVLSIILFFNLIKHRSTNSGYHITGLIIAVIVGFYTSVGSGMELIDFYFRLGEREKIVEQVKGGPVKAGNIIDQNFFRLSDGGEVSYTKSPNGAVDVEFYIDRGFLDHYSSFLYTNDIQEIKNLDK